MREKGLDKKIIVMSSVSGKEQIMGKQRQKHWDSTITTDEKIWSRMWNFFG